MGDKVPYWNELLVAIHPNRWPKLARWLPAIQITGYPGKPVGLTPKPGFLNVDTFYKNAAIHSRLTRTQFIDRVAGK